VAPDERVLALPEAGDPASIAAETRGVPFLNPESSSPTLTERGFKWFFRSGPHDRTFTSMFYQMFADLKKRGRKISKFAILSENTEFGATAARVAEEMGRQQGYQLVGREMYTSPPASLDAELARVRAAAPDVLIANNYLIDAVTAIRTLKTMRYMPPAIAGASVLEADYERVAARMGREADPCVRMI